MEGNLITIKQLYNRVGEMEQNLKQALSELTQEIQEENYMKCYSLREVSQMLSVTTNTVRNRIKRGELKAFFDHSMMYVRHQDLKKYLNKKTKCS